MSLATAKARTAWAILEEWDVMGVRIGVWFARQTG